MTHPWGWKQARCLPARALFISGATCWTRWREAHGGHKGSQVSGLKDGVGMRGAGPPEGHSEGTSRCG